MSTFGNITPLKWLYLDLNSFFASCEQDHNPALRGRAVAVLPAMTDSTCAIAASYEAKKFGIKTGTKIYEAKKLCPDLICVPARHDLYVQYHHKILGVAIKHISINKVYSVDEFSSRLPPDKRSRDDVLKIVQALKHDLLQDVGPMITASIGVAPNAYLAKIATDLQKPDGLIIIDPLHIESVLSNLSLTDLPGINFRMQARLNKSKIFSPPQFYNLQPKHARAVWGSVGGEILWYKLHGYDIPERETNRSVVGHSRILDPEHRAPDVAHLVLRRLVLKAASRLRRLNLFTAQIHVAFKTTDGEYVDDVLKLSATQDNFILLNATNTIWHSLIARARPFRLRKVAVDFFDLFERREITDDLFAEPPKILKTHANLDKALDALNQKYGAETVRIGISPKTKMGFVGTKIAFNRIPEAAEFAE